FSNIINALQALDKTYSNSEMVRKILRCLPKLWMPKVTAIEEGNNLNILPLEDLVGSLMTHELSMQNKDDDEEKGKKEIICFECNKPEHYKSDCPRLKKKDLLKKKKAMISTWDDSDESSSDEDSSEEVAQLALMALEEENDEVTYDELLLVVEKYSYMITSLNKKVKTLRKENEELKSINLSKEDNSNEIEVDILENEVAFLEKQNRNLKEEIDALKKTFSKFSNSSEKLENLLGMQMCVFDKAGLGYEEMNN
ncbi:zf-CCHC domain-containing protein/UBN2 domain-containing protein, partial [Cephalotus follicularis]